MTSQVHRQTQRVRDLHNMPLYTSKYHTPRAHTSTKLFQSAVLLLCLKIRSRWLCLCSIERLGCYWKQRTNNRSSRVMFVVVVSLLCPLDDSIEEKKMHELTQCVNKHAVLALLPNVGEMFLLKILSNELTLGGTLSDQLESRCKSHTWQLINYYQPVYCFTQSKLFWWCFQFQVRSTETGTNFGWNYPKSIQNIQFHRETFSLLEPKMFLCICVTSLFNFHFETSLTILLQSL